jgi:cytochrome P450
MDTAHHDPVTDWSTDFDHTDEAWSKNPFPIWDELRETCPVAHSDRYNGAWLPTTHEAVNDVAYDTDNFTSWAVVVSNDGPQIDTRPMGGAPPITSDPPFHAIARRILLPAFGPKVIAELEPQIRELCRRLLDEIAGRDVVDAASEYAAHIPPDVIAQMLGLPKEDNELFREFVHGTLENVAAPTEVRQAFFAGFDAYLSKQIQDHIDNPRDDLISFLLDVEVMGQKLLPEHVGGTIVLLLVAGIDTTWSAIGASIWHLANNPDHVERLRNEPELWDTAIEEFLRAYAPVTMARLVAKDHEFHGCPMKEGEWVLLPFPAANRDPKVFDRADEVLLDRAENRHAAFGLGIHRCIGSNLARLELRVALEEWVARYPVFSVVNESDVRWSTGQVRGPRQMALRVSTQ